MATITITASGLTPRAKTISAAHVARLLVAYRATFGQVDNGAGGLRDRTDQEVFDLFADNIFAEIRRTTRLYEDGALTKANTDIAFT